MAATDGTVPETATAWQRGVAATEVALLAALLLFSVVAIHTRAASHYLAVRSYTVMYATAIGACVSLYAPIATLIGLGAVSCDALTYSFIAVHVCVCSGPLWAACACISKYHHARTHARMYVDAHVASATAAAPSRPAPTAVPSIALGSIPADTPLSLPSHRSMAPAIKSILKAPSMRNMTGREDAAPRDEPQPVEAHSPPPASSRGLGVAGSSRNLNLNLYRPTSMRTLPLGPSTSPPPTSTPPSTAREDTGTHPLTAADIESVPLNMRLQFPRGLEPGATPTDAPRLHVSGDVFLLEMVETVTASQSVWGPAGMRLWSRVAVSAYVIVWCIVAIVLAAQPASPSLPLNSGTVRCVPWKGGIILFGVLDLLYLVLMLILSVLVHSISISDDMHLAADVYAFILNFTVCFVLFYAGEAARATGTTFTYNTHSTLTLLCMVAVIITLARPALMTYTAAWAPIVTSAIDPHSATTPRVGDKDETPSNACSRAIAMLCSGPHTPRTTHSSVSTVEVRSGDAPAVDVESGSHGDASAALGRSRVRSSLIVTESRSVRALMDMCLKDKLGRFLFASHAQRTHSLVYLLFYVEAVKFRRIVTPFMIVHDRAVAGKAVESAAHPGAGKPPVSSRSSSRDQQASAARYAPPPPVGAQRHTVCTSPLGAAVLLYQRYLNRDSVHALPFTSTLTAAHIVAVETALTEAAGRASGAATAASVTALRNPYAHAGLKSCSSESEALNGPAASGGAQMSPATVAADVFDDLVSIIHAHILRESFARFMDSAAFKLWSETTPAPVPVVTRTREASARNLLGGASARNLNVGSFNRSSATVVPVDA